MVDVTNFTDNTWPVGHDAPPEGAPASRINTGHGVFHSGALHVVERFTRSMPTRSGTARRLKIRTSLPQPWTVEYDGLRRAPEGHMLYEYACHEGNARNLKLMTGTEF